MRIFIILTCLCLLTACGQKGALYLPESQQVDNLELDAQTLAKSAKSKKGN